MSSLSSLSSSLLLWLKVVAVGGGAVGGVVVVGVGGVGGPSVLADDQWVLSVVSVPSFLLLRKPFSFRIKGTQQ